jgi:hypothetical protein
MGDDPQRDAVVGAASVLAVFVAINYSFGMFWLYLLLTMTTGLVTAQLYRGQTRWTVLAAVGTLNAVLYVAGFHTRFADTFVVDSNPTVRLLFAAAVIMLPLFIGARTAVVVFARES